MHSVTFFYKILGHPKFYNGKYICFDLPLFHHGLDRIIVPKLLTGVNEYRMKDSMYYIEKKDLSVGIVSAYFHNSIYHSSSDEIKHFDFYCIANDRNPENHKIYMNGNLM